MQSPIPSRDYISSASFEIERDYLFQEYWIFATLQAPVRLPNQFITKTIGGISIVIQNIEGELKAFENVCTHRQMPIQWERRGKRPLTCHFHGWHYDKTGAPSHIPNYNDLYQFSQAALDRLPLRQITIEQVGQMVFVNLSANPLPITAQFNADLLAFLTQMSSHFDDEILETTMKVPYNWKLAVEVIQDPNHVQFLHAKTLAKHVQATDILDASGNPTPYQSDSNAILNASAENCHVSDLSFNITEPLRDYHRAFWFDQVNRFDSSPYDGQSDQPIYRDIFLFPNTHLVSSTWGHSFSIECYYPLSENETEIELQMMLASKKGPMPNAAAILLRHAVEGQVVLDEDIEGCTRQHQGIIASRHQTELGHYEMPTCRLRSWFQRYYHQKSNAIPMGML